MVGVGQKKIDSIPTRLEVDLCSKTVGTLRAKHVMLFWEGVGLVNASKTHSTGLLVNVPYVKFRVKNLLATGMVL
jgi:hypothetical protein